MSGPFDMKTPTYVVPTEKPGLPCPCCRHITLAERGGYEICPVCFWEDDGQDDDDASVVRGGPNGSLSLAQARENFRSLGACDERSVQRVRKPYLFELP
ncbi:CPCC family cysteine-rich protein [Variovorax sp. VRV01]|uniref:CPCC family cysteine-rich protein n=1 Tax=Variovorax sp. VRV01 TaxID=2769259 RepID=UPI00298D1CC3|nr:CPCC family cysteine-rich protein [Variovorax sp. VRV01]